MRARSDVIGPLGDYTGKTLRGLGEILGLLAGWTEGRSGKDFGMPDVYKGYEAREVGQEVVKRGIEAASAAALDLDPETLAADSLDADAAETLALAVIIQSWDFIRDGAWDRVDDGVLPLVLCNIERDHKFVPALRAILEEHGGDIDRTPVLNKLGSLEHHLAQYAREGRKIVEERGLDQNVDPGDLDPEEPISFDSMDDSLETKSPIRLETPEKKAPAPGETDKPQTIPQTMRSALDTEELRARIADDKAEAAGNAASKYRAFRRVGLVTIFVLAILAIVSLAPLLRIGAPPSLDTYEGYLPLSGVIRPSDGEVPYMVVMIRAEWDQMPEQQRTEGMQALFEHVNRVEKADYIIVRGRDGLDDARIDSNGVEHYR